MTTLHAFAVGAHVRVRKREAQGHVRTPGYVMGKSGIVEKQQGHYRNPEELAYGRRDAQVLPLYTVRFAQRDLWPDYDGMAQDTLVADIFEHWLEAAE